MHIKWFTVTLPILFSLVASCVSTPPPKPKPVKERVAAKYNEIRNKRYVVFIEEESGVRSKTARIVEARIRSTMTRKGLTVVDFHQSSVANYLRADGRITDSFAKSVASTADLIIAGRIDVENIDDADINGGKDGTYRSRITSSLAITESNSAIEKARLEEVEVQELAKTHKSATKHAAKSLGTALGEAVIGKLLYVYKD